VIEVRPFKPYHVDLLRAQGVQASQIAEVSIVPGTYANVAQPEGPAVSAFAGEQVLLCGGIWTYGRDRGICWALLSQQASKHMQWLHYATKRFITMKHWQRLEATVQKDFREGCRWVELLGFKFEGEMPRYGDNGETHLRYGRYG
jgi:hypothetical protein